MIKKLDIHNFQSHQKTSLEFHHGVNTIIGSSDSGKSAIIRALNWVINNRPTGDSIIQYGQESAKVSITLDPGQVIARGKSKATNYYTISSGTEKKQEFKAIKTDVPDEVGKVLKYNELNLQYQMDAPY